MSEGKFDGQNRAQMVETTLGLLNAVENEGASSQRKLASHLGVALGLTNALLKRCVRKGLLKAHEIPARRYIYYLTPKGFSEKSRLTRDYLSSSLGFYRKARQEYADVFVYCQTRGWSSIVLYAASELAEIAILAANEAGVSITSIIDPETNKRSFHELPIIRTIEEYDDNCPPDAIVVCDMHAPQETFVAMLKVLSEENILTPPLLHVIRNKQSGGT